MIVVDVNVIVYLLTETPQREQARRVRERDGDWLVPPLWRHEMLNVLTTLTRQEVLDKSSALTVWRNAIGLLGSREQQPDMETHELRPRGTRIRFDAGHSYYGLTALYIIYIMRNHGCGRG